MAKVTGPLLSLDASGSVASTITYSRWKGINYVRQRIIPTYTNTVGQQAVRDFWTQASQAWKGGATIGGVTIDASYKLAFATAAAGLSMSGFNLYMNVASLKNDIAGGFSGTLVLPSDPTDIS